MNKLRLILPVIALMCGTAMQAGQVADHIMTAQDIVNQVVSVVEPLADLAGGEKKAKYYSEHKPKILRVKDTVAGAYNIVLNVEDFIAKDLENIKQIAAKLKRQLDCLKNPAGACAEVGCTSKNACIAAVLKTTKELIMPISSALLATGKKDDKGNIAFDNGALFNLASLKGLPVEVQNKLRKNITEFAAKLNQALAFMDTLAFVLNPVIEKPADMTEAEKTKLVESLKVEPISIPADTDFPSLD